MLALKKAYAEIILNTAKEAAMRVMASERKALRFQQDLRATKDDALRMLVRLKQTFDSKVLGHVNLNVLDTVNFEFLFLSFSIVIFIFLYDFRRSEF